MKEMAKVDAAEASVRNDSKDIESMFGQKEDVSCASSKIVIKNNISAIHQENEGVCRDEYDMGF